MHEKARPGEKLTAETAEIGMICLDVYGKRVVIDRIVDMDRVEIGEFWNGTLAFMGDRLRCDELTFTGEMHEFQSMTEKE